MDRAANGILHRYAAFTSDPAGGNPAGVWVGDQLPAPEEMQRIAAEVGYSETAFVAPASGLARTVRYFSPEMEVPFCGHATIATGVALAASDGEGVFTLDTRAGQIPVTVREHEGRVEASLVSVDPKHEDVSDALVSEITALLGWHADDLDPAIPAAKAFAGAWHLVLAAHDRERLESLDYDFDALKATMEREGLVTLQLVCREDAIVFHSRNPFPVGGVVEDPATGAAAAALGGYLRDAALIEAPAAITIRQGEAMGQPSLLEVEIPKHGGIVVKGTAVPILSVL
ncbi:MAG: PhzF family phenazine biosynthesis isomerase [Pseudomonadota bacterium]